MVRLVHDLLPYLELRVWGQGLRRQEHLVGQLLRRQQVTPRDGVGDPVGDGEHLRDAEVRRVHPCRELALPRFVGAHRGPRDRVDRATVVVGVLDDQVINVTRHAANLLGITIAPVIFDSGSDVTPLADERPPERAPSAM